MELTTLAIVTVVVELGFAFDAAVAAAGDDELYGSLC